MNTRPSVLILHATGTNRDWEAAHACEMAGATAEIVHVNQLIGGERRLADYQMLVLPGGFSYGDDLGAGKVWAILLRHRLAEDLALFIGAGRPVLGICNGFQVLVKTGLLPGITPADAGGQAPLQAATLTRNDSSRFECRWVYLEPQTASPCIFTRGLTEPIYCPVAHGEGKFVARDAAALDQIQAQGLVALRYVTPAGLPAAYPWNPNGSAANIAGICNPAGTVFGLMPHPEDHVLPEQHPRYARGERGGLGLALFANGVRYAAQL
jgi:phosphoribosylformylglycinamidine synthase subunit PurQ / glutaminase